jgi:hypothetical protein
MVGTESAQAAKLLQRTTGRSEFRIADYDYFALFGLDLSPAIAVKFSENFRIWRANARVSDKRLLSRPAFIESVAGQLRRTLAIVVATKLRAATERPIFVVPQPCPVEGVLAPLRGGLFDLGKTSGKSIRWEAAAAMGTELYRLFVRAAQTTVSSLGISFLEQPAETRTLGILTKETYRYFDPAKKVDYAHMNAEYGAAVLRHLVPQYRALTGGAAGKPVALSQA